MVKEKSSFISGILFFFFGLFVFLNPDMIVKFISYFIGGVLIALGLYKTVNYYVQDKKNGIVNTNELGFGVTMAILGILLVCLAGTIEFLTRVIIGAWLIVSGLSRISSTFYTTDRGSKFYSLIVVGLIYIGGGLYTIIDSNLPFKILGIFMMVYGVIDFMGYFVYKDTFTSSKEPKIKEAELIEEKREEDKDTNENKKSN